MLISRCSRRGLQIKRAAEAGVEIASNARVVVPDKQRVLGEGFIELTIYNLQFYNLQFAILQSAIRFLTSGSPKSGAAQRKPAAS